MKLSLRLCQAFLVTKEKKVFSYQGCLFEETQSERKLYAQAEIATALKPRIITEIQIKTQLTIFSTIALIQISKNLLRKIIPNLERRQKGRSPLNVCPFKVTGHCFKAQGLLNFLGECTIV